MRAVAINDQRRQGSLWKFDEFTEEERAFLNNHNLLAAEEPLQQSYETSSRKPEKMAKYENAPRRCFVLSRSCVASWECKTNSASRSPADLFI
ncbi:hypothetical protein FQU85_00750 (plasmid) [Salarchaeum sp. JOR-1]|nr:hypothetical protein FQU85_00750 [Salarchaeum sp. JOR-1]